MNIEAIRTELQDLEATHASLPVAELQSRRAAATDAARAIFNADGDDFSEAYDLIIALDRVGY